MTWQNSKIGKIGGVVSYCVGEFNILMPEILPYGKMKIKIYESQEGKFAGFTNILIKRKFDGYPEGAAGFGKSIEAALEDTIWYFQEMLKEDDKTELAEKDIEYGEYSDF